MRLIDADALDEEVMHLFITITGNPKQSTVVNECKKSFRDMIEVQPTAGDWIPADNPPEVDESGVSDYILLSFMNFDIPLIGRYQLDKDGGGAYYDGDSDRSCISTGLFVNAWMPLPEPYKD